MQLALQICLLSFLVGFATSAGEVQTLNTVTLEKIPLKTKERLSITSARPTEVALPQLMKQESVEQTKTKKERSFPEWRILKPLYGEKIFPVMTKGNKTFVSIYGEGITFSADLSKKIQDEHRKNSSAESFFIKGNLVEKIFTEMKFSKNEKLYWFLFADMKERIVDIGEVSRLLIIPNAAGDNVFGALGIEISIDSNSSSSLVPVGLANVGFRSELNPSSAVIANFAKTDMNVPKEKLLEFADFMAPLGEGGERIVKNPLEFTKLKLGDVDFIQASAGFSRTESGQDSLENLYGFFLKSNADALAVYDFYMDSTYFYKPEKIFVGKWLKRYDDTLFISSTGMGDCGRFILVKKSTIKVIPVLCGSWGC